MDGTDSAAHLEHQRQLELYARDVRAAYAREVRHSTELEATYLATVRALAAAVEAKDGYTGGHLLRVQAVGLLLAQEIVPADASHPQLAYGFLLHDVGKLAVPDAVLTKPGPLNEAERALIRTHPEAGVRILSVVPFLKRAVEVVRHHHERWDGTGYPDGLAGEQIPLWARIFAVADALDAMTSERPYRRPVSLGEALDEAQRCSGSHFDPECVEVLLSIDRRQLGRLLQCSATEQRARWA